MNRKISRNKVLFAVYIQKKGRCVVVLGEVIVPARGGIHKAKPPVKRAVANLNIFLLLHVFFH